MSGITGLYHRDGAPAGHDVVGNMTDALQHRGPDAGAVWSEGSIGMGHRMMWTTPESLEEQLPWSYEGITITADARIDNREELLRLFDLPNHGQPDSHLVVHAYLKWGSDCVAYLLGDFAFALWDLRKQVLFCARDPMGVKPFYYYRSDQLFAFASEIKGLLTLPAIPRRLNEAKLADYLAPVFIDQQSTYYQDILKLEPGHSLFVDAEKIVHQQYWAFDVPREVNLTSDEAYAEAFRSHFEEAVRCRLRSHYPAGATFSGGLDSSAIVCTARNILSNESDLPFHTFSAIFPENEDPGIDEQQYIDAVLGKGGFRSHFIQADQSKAVADVSLFVDEVLAAPNMYMTIDLLRAAGEEGVRVLLSGFDGDAVVSYGYEYLGELARSGRWRQFKEEAQALESRQPHTRAKTYLRVYGLPELEPLAEEKGWFTLLRSINSIASNFGMSRRRLLSNHGPGALKKSRYNGRAGSQQAAGLSLVMNGCIHSDFAIRSGLLERLQNMKGNDKDQTGGMSYFIHYLTERFDEIAAVNAVEQRYPFFDRRLVEFCQAVPANQKLSDGWSRLIFRRAMDGIVPRKIQWRLDKGDISSNIRYLLASERIKLEQILFQGDASIASYVDMDLLRAAFQRFMSDPVRATDRDVFSLVLSAHLALWLSHSGLH